MNVLWYLSNGGPFTEQGARVAHSFHCPVWCLGIRALAGGQKFMLVFQDGTFQFLVFVLLGKYPVPFPCPHPDSPRVVQPVPSAVPTGMYGLPVAQD